MKALKIVGIVVLLYVGLVVGFESLLGYFQPSGDTTLVITTFDPDGTSQPRVVSQIDSDGQLYVAANHWPRAWYQRALENPNVRVAIGGQTRDHVAVPVTGVEHERVAAARPLGPIFRVLTGFPPRYFLRLDPREAGRDQLTE